MMTILDPTSHNYPDPDENMTPSILKKLHLNAVETAYGELMLLDFPYSRSAYKGVLMFGRKSGTNEFVFVKRIPYDQDISTAFSRYRHNSGQIRVESATFTGSTVQVKGQTFGVVFNEVPNDIATINPYTLSSYASQDQGYFSGLVPIMDGAQVLAAPATANPYRTPLTGGYAPDGTHPELQLTVEDDANAGNWIDTTTAWTNNGEIVAIEKAELPPLARGRVRIDAQIGCNNTSTQDSVTVHMYVRSRKATSATDYTAVNNDRSVSRQILLEPGRSSFPLRATIDTGDELIERIWIAPTDVGGPNLFRANAGSGSDSSVDIAFRDMDYTNQAFASALLVTGIDSGQNVVISGVKNVQCVPDAETQQNVKTVVALSNLTDERQMVHKMLHDNPHIALASSNSKYEAMLASLDSLADPDYMRSFSFGNFVKGAVKGIRKGAGIVAPVLQALPSPRAQMAGQFLDKIKSTSATMRTTSFQVAPHGPLAPVPLRLGGPAPLYRSGSMQTSSAGLQQLAEDVDEEVRFFDYEDPLPEFIHAPPTQLEMGLHLVDAFVEHPTKARAGPAARQLHAALNVWAAHAQRIRGEVLGITNQHIFNMPAMYEYVNELNEAIVTLRKLARLLAQEANLPQPHHFLTTTMRTMSGLEDDGMDDVPGRFEDNQTEELGDHNVLKVGTVLSALHNQSTVRAFIERSAGREVKSAVSPLGVVAGVGVLDNVPVPLVVVASHEPFVLVDEGGNDVSSTPFTQIESLVEGQAPCYAPSFIGEGNMQSLANATRRPPTHPYVRVFISPTAGIRPREPPSMEGGSLGLPMALASRGFSTPSICSGAFGEDGVAVKLGDLGYKAALMSNSPSGGYLALAPEQLEKARLSRRNIGTSSGDFFTATPRFSIMAASLFSDFIGYLCIANLTPRPTEARIDYLKEQQARQESAKHVPERRDLNDDLAEFIMELVKELPSDENSANPDAVRDAQGAVADYVNKMGGHWDPDQIPYGSLLAFKRAVVRLKNLGIPETVPNFIAQAASTIDNLKMKKPKAAKKKKKEKTLVAPPKARVQLEDL